MKTGIGEVFELYGAYWKHEIMCFLIEDELLSSIIIFILILLSLFPLISNRFYLHIFSIAPQNLLNMYKYINDLSISSITSIMLFIIGSTLKYLTFDGPIVNKFPCL